MFNLLVWQPTVNKTRYSLLYIAVPLELIIGFQNVWRMECHCNTTLTVYNELLRNNSISEMWSPLNAAIKVPGGFVIPKECRKLHIQRKPQKKNRQKLQFIDWIDLEVGWVNIYFYLLTKILYKIIDDFW